LKLSDSTCLDGQNHYLGVITTNDLIRHLAGISSMDQPGGIIVLELIERDYSLSQIAQIVESNMLKCSACISLLRLNQPSLRYPEVIPGI